jgi:hypothetical protein
MTQPPVDPAPRDPITDASPTEPVPVPAPPSGMPAFAAPEPAPGLAGAAAPGAAGAPVASAPPPLAFAPPEPGPGAGFIVPPTRPTTASRNGGSRILTIALGAAVLVGAMGLAFAAGRATSTAGDTGAVSSGQGLPGNRGGVSDRGAQDDQGGPGPRQQGGLGGGNLPGASFDLNGNGNGRGGDLDGDHALPPGGGFGREGFGGPTVSGTVESVDGDSVTIKTSSGLTVTVGLDGTTTYHQQTAAQASDVAVGKKVEISVAGRIRPDQASNGELNLGTASDVTIVP